MRVLGINAVFHDPAAALVVDGEIVAAAEEERFSRRKHGKPPVPSRPGSCPSRRRAGASPTPASTRRPRRRRLLLRPGACAAPDEDLTADGWEGLRTLYRPACAAVPRTALPGLDPERVRFVPHHVAHAASAHAGGALRCVRGAGARRAGRAASHLAGHARDGRLEVLAAQRLPHSLGLLYEELTEHLGFRRSSDEYKVMALASYGKPSCLDELARLVRTRRRRRLR